MSTADPLQVERDLTSVTDEAKVARGETIRLVLRSKTFIVGALIVLFWIVCAILGSHLTPKSPYATSINVFAHPSGTYWFGTDKNGRDVFARVIAGAHDILIVTPLATLLGTVLGTVVGLITGYFRGVVDDVVSRIVDALLAMPLIIVAVLTLTALGTSNTTVIVVIGVIFTPLIARTVRSAVLGERELEYVQAARLRGEGPLYIMFVEILPNVYAPILVEFTVRLGYAIFTVASLSFIGFGLQPPSPDWGLQISEHYGNVQNAYWTVLFPAGAIALLIIGVNLMADGVATAVDQ
jgi:peptide/nickel transport system permease protein